MIVCAARAMLMLTTALVLAGTSTAPATSATDECATFRSWFVQQPGSKLVLSATQNFDQKFANAGKRDTILNYSPIPFSNDRAAWYLAMKHYRTNVGNGRCFSAFYDSAHKSALVLSENGTGSDLTMMSVSNAPAGLRSGSVPQQTQNGVRFGMTIAQVQAIDGTGTLRSDGGYKQLFYSQNVKKSDKVTFINYLGFLFANEKLVAADAGGGI
jgi:hypothetical protein